jgi:hypothetical protein
LWRGRLTLLSKARLDVVENEHRQSLYAIGLAHSNQVNAGSHNDPLAQLVRAASR